MKTALRIILAALAPFLWGIPVHSANVTSDEAARVAQNWVAAIVAKEGHWGPTDNPQIGEPVELKEGDRVVGYYFEVKPSGCIVVSTVKDLPPIRAYSTMSRLDPAAGEGPAGMMKSEMDRALTRIEKHLGKKLENASPDEIKKAAQSDHERSWQQLGISADSPTPAPGTPGGPITMNYATSKVLLSTMWNQNDPYDDKMPAGSTCAHYPTGCVPLAAAQVMRYWSWPPYGQGSPFSDAYYNWDQMPDIVTPSSPQSQIDAVSRLCYEAGTNCGLTLDCDGSHTNLSCWWAGCSSMEKEYKENFRYVDSSSEDRNAYDAVGWWDLVKNNLNANMPMHYRIPGHSIVVDGWKEVGSTPERFYHINYGWGPGSGSFLGWFAMDHIPAPWIPGGESDLDQEYALNKLMPKASLGSLLLGNYSRDTSFPYRYFNVDAVGIGNTFSAGQLLQFLPGVRLLGTVRIEGSTTQETRLFSEGRSYRGIRIAGGVLNLTNAGGMVLNPLGAPKQLSAAWETNNPGINVSWDAGHGNQMQFEIQRQVGSGPFTYYATVGATFFADWGVDTSQDYTYRVRAIGQTGQLSEWSDEMKVP